MDRRQLLAFLTSARTLNFSQAANILGYAQSSITAQIQRLESTLQVQLFDRSNGRVRLTSFGERLLPYAERLLDLADEAVMVTRADSGVSRSLVIGTEECIASYWLPGIIEAFHHRSPEMMLSPRTFDDCRQALESVDTGDVDVVLQPRFTEPAGEFQFALVGEQDVVLVAAADHPVRAEQAITAAVLDKVPTVISQASSTYSRLLRNEFGELASVRLEFGTVEAAKRAAGNGLGVCLLPRIAVRDQIRAGVLAELPWRPATRVRVYAIWPRRLDGSSVLRTFVSLARRTIEDDP